LDLLATTAHKILRFFEIAAGFSSLARLHQQTGELKKGDVAEAFVAPNSGKWNTTG